MKIILAAFISVLFLTQEANAQVAQQEIAAFFSQQRKEKADFEQGILEETDSRTAATQRFNVKAREDRVAFTKSLQEAPADERPQRLAEFNAAVLQNQRDFKKTLPTLPKSKFEKALDDFDKKSAEDAKALIGQLGDTDPVLRSETIRQFQNTLKQRRAKLQNDTQNEFLKRKRKFQLDQAQKMREFVAS